MSSDFEIESPVQRKATKGSKYLSNFGGDEDEDDVYNYEVTQSKANTSKKGAVNSYQKSPVKAPVKGNDRGGGAVSKSTNALYSKSSSNDVMDKAAMMLAKYNNVSKSVDASNNQYLSRNASKSFNKLPSRFDEDELSIGSEDDDDEDDDDDDSDEVNDSSEYELSTSRSLNSKNKNTNAKSNPINKQANIKASVPPNKTTTIQSSPRRSEVFGNVQSINDLEQSISMDESEAYNSSLNMSNSYSRPSPVSAEKHAAEDTIIDEEFDDDINDRYGIVANEPSSDTIEEAPADEPEAPKIVSFADIGKVAGWNATVEVQKPAVAQTRQAIQPVYSENEPTAANRYNKPVTQDMSSSNPTPYSSYPHHPAPPMPHPTNSQEMPTFYGHPGYMPYPHQPNPMAFSMPNYFNAHPLHSMMSTSMSMMYPPPMMSMSQSSNYNSSDPVIIDLLRELKQAKEDAAWAKQRLADMITLVNKNKSSKRASSPYEEYSEYEEEYSNDFESSVLNNSQDTTKKEKEKENNRKGNNSPHSSKPQPIQPQLVVPTPYYQESTLRMNSALATSQDMFRKQLSSLRERVNTINSNPSAFNPSSSSNSAGSKTTPTLQELKKQFEVKRIENNKKLVELLMQQDLSLSEVQAKRLASGY